MTTETAQVLEMRGITKRFGSLQALNGVDFSVNENEIVGLVGDNGAGKSTLIKTLVGLHDADQGEICLHNQPVEISDPKEAQEHGIATVYQDLALVDEQTVAMNLHLGRPLTRRVGGIIPIVDWEKMNKNAERLLRENLNIHIDPESKVEFLSGGERQAIAICRALVTEPDIVVMDEPTSALSADAARRVMDLIRSLRDQGISVVVISHNLDEIFGVTDRMTVLSNGEQVTTVDTEAVDREQVIQMMISETVPNDVSTATQSES